MRFSGVHSAGSWQRTSGFRSLYEIRGSGESMRSTASRVSVLLMRFRSHPSIITPLTIGFRSPYEIPSGSITVNVALSGTWSFRSPYEIPITTEGQRSCRQSGFRSPYEIQKMTVERLEAAYYSFRSPYEIPATRSTSPSSSCLVSVLHMRFW